MLIEVWHLAETAWALAVSWLGSTTFGVLFPFITFAIVFLLLLAVKGRTSARTYLGKTLGIGFLAALTGWSGLYGWATIRSIYIDHLLMAGYVRTTKNENGILRAHVADLLNEHELDNNRIISLTTNLTLKNANQQGVLQSNPPSMDPDALYQFGEKVAEVPSGLVDRTSGTVMFPIIAGGSNYQFSAKVEYRQFSLSGCAVTRAGVHESSTIVISGMLQKQNFSNIICHIDGINH